MKEESYREELIKAIIRLLERASAQDIKTVYIFALNIIA